MQEVKEPIIEIAENALSATLIVSEHVDRATLSPSLFNALLTKAGVKLEYTTRQLADDLIAKAQAAPAESVRGIIAKGTPVTHGKDAYVKWAEGAQDKHKPNAAADPQAEQADNTDDASDDAAICFYNRSVYTVVLAGDIIGQVYPEVPGTEGCDVFGKTLVARTAKPLDLKYDESISINKQNQIVANNDGVLVINGKTALISDTIQVDQNVDFNTGNIDFNGNIIVHHSVKDCFVVKATEDVEVRGLIEAATIITGKDLRALGGFAGREQGVAKVDGNLHAKYLDAVNVDVRGDLCVDREVINCKTTVLGDIRCPRGALIGGTTHVSGHVELLDLGAGAQPLTTLHIGVLPHLDPHIKQLAALVADLIEQRQKLLDEQEVITSNSGKNIAPTHKAMLNNITYQIAEVQKHLDRAEPSLQSTLERAEALRTIDVLVMRKLHPNAVLVFGDFHYRIKGEMKGPIRITANRRGQLEYQIGETKPVMLSTEADLRIAA